METFKFKRNIRSQKLIVVLKKIYILAIFIFFSNHIQSQDINTVQDTIVLKEVSVEAISIYSKEKKELYPINEITFEEFQSLTPQNNLGEYLESVPSLFVMNNHNFAQDSRISIRGFGSRANFGIRGIKIFVDGIPETSPDGQTQIDNINLEIIEKIKVYRGNNSSFFGSSSGGIISITTLENFDKNFVNIGYSFGSFNTNKTQATIGINKKDQKMIFFGSRTKSEGYRNHSSYENLNFNFKYIRKINQKNKLQIVSNFLDSPDAMDPGGLNISEVLSDRSQARARNVNYDSREKVKQYKIGFNLLSQINQVKMTNSLYYNKRVFDGKLPIGNGGIIDLNRTFYGYDLNLDYSKFMDYNFGASFNNQKDNRQRFVNDSGTKSDKVMGQYEKYSNASLFFFATKKIKKLDLSFGFRIEENKIVLDNYFNNSENENSETINSFNPSFNFVYNFEKFNISANFSTGYETPTLNELSATLNQSGFNQDLLPIKSKTYEIGISNDMTNQDIKYNFRVFSIISKNEITPYESSSGLRLYRNAGETSKKGLELELNSKINKEIFFDYTLTLGDYRFEEFIFNENDYSNNQIPGIPKNMQKLSLNYNDSKDFNLILTWKNVGKLYANNSNETAVDGFNIFNLKFSKKIKLPNQIITPFLSFDNLFGSEYYDNIRINAFGSRFYEPAPGMSFIAGVKINL